MNLIEFGNQLFDLRFTAEMNITYYESLAANASWWDWWGTFGVSLLGMIGIILSCVAPFIKNKVKRTRPKAAVATADSPPIALVNSNWKDWLASNRADVTLAFSFVLTIISSVLLIVGLMQSTGKDAVRYADLVDRFRDVSGDVDELVLEAQKQSAVDQTVPEYMSARLASLTAKLKKIGDAEPDDTNITKLKAAETKQYIATYGSNVTTRDQAIKLRGDKATWEQWARAQIIVDPKERAEHKKEHQTKARNNATLKTGSLIREQQTDLIRR